jgi:AcrR family transcriptional regulator
MVAALQLFSEQGYDETTVAEIADRAGLTSRDARRRVRYAPLAERARHRRDETDLLELGALAFKQAFATWIDADENQDLAELSVAALDRLRTTVAQLA